MKPESLQTTRTANQHQPSQQLSRLWHLLIGMKCPCTFQCLADPSRAQRDSRSGNKKSSRDNFFLRTAKHGPLSAEGSIAHVEGRSVSLQESGGRREALQEGNRQEFGRNYRDPSLAAMAGERVRDRQSLDAIRNAGSRNDH